MLTTPRLVLKSFEDTDVEKMVEILTDSKIKETFMIPDFETKENAILNASDKEMMDWAFRTVNYKRNKGLDFVGRFNGKYLIGEAKFLSDFGGHQDAQLEDAILTLTAPNVKATKIAILDGVCWLKTNNKMYKAITEEYCEENVMSALLLKDFIKSL